MAQPEMIRRKVATDATFARFRRKVHSWAKGITCVHLGRFQLRKMGHKPPTLPRFRSAFAAKQALQERGWATVADMLDEVLPAARIPPARMLLGDLAVTPTEDGLGAINVCAGPHKLMGWHDAADGLIMLDVTLDELVGAWRL